jgi:hypothetical protein
LNMKTQVDPNTTITGSINTPLSPTDKSSRQINQQGNFRIKWHYRTNGFKVIYRIFHPKAEEYDFFIAAHGIFSKINYNLGHKANANK